MVEDNYYDSIAKGYDELYLDEQLEKLKIIEKLNIIKNNHTLLDVGCGTGISTAYFNCKKAIGIDPSAKLLKIAKNKYPDIKFINTSAESMKFKEKFDIVISLTAIQNFKNIEKGLKNIKKYGKIFILTFLKKSTKREDIETSIGTIFKVKRRIEEKKDIIYICG